MIEFLLYIIVVLIGVLLLAIMLDRYWGTAFLGKIVPPRSPLIYEGRQWWMEHVAKFVVIGVVESFFLVISWWVFISYNLNELLNPLGILWAILLIAIGIVAVFRDKPEMEN